MGRKTETSFLEEAVPSGSKFLESRWARRKEPHLVAQKNESSPSNRDPGQQVANPSPIKQLARAYTAAGRSLSSI